MVGKRLEGKGKTLSLQPLFLTFSREVSLPLNGVKGEMNREIFDSQKRTYVL
jgi:hypothetical protein